MELGAQHKRYNVTVTDSGQPRVAACVSPSQISRFRDHLLDSCADQEKLCEWREHRNSPQLSLLMAAEWALEGEVAALLEAKKTLEKKAAEENKALSRIKETLASCEKEIAAAEKQIRKRMGQFDRAAEELNRCDRERKSLESETKSQAETNIRFGLVFDTLRESPAYFASGSYIGNGERKPSEIAMGSGPEEWAAFGKISLGMFPPALMDLCLGKISQYETDASQLIKSCEEHITGDDDYLLLRNMHKSARNLEKLAAKFSQRRRQAADAETNETMHCIITDTEERLKPIENELRVLSEFRGIIAREKRAAEIQFGILADFLKQCPLLERLLARKKETERQLAEKTVDSVLEVRIDAVAGQIAIASSSLESIRRERWRLEETGKAKETLRRKHELASSKDDMRGKINANLVREAYVNIEPKAEPREATREEKFETLWNAILAGKIMQDFVGTYPEMEKNAKQMLQSLAEMYAANGGTLTYKTISLRHSQHTRKEISKDDGIYTLVRVGLDSSDRFRFILDLGNEHAPLLLFAGIKDDCDAFMKNNNYASAKGKALGNGEAELFKRLL